MDMWTVFCILFGVTILSVMGLFIAIWQKRNPYLQVKEKDSKKTVLLQLSIGDKVETSIYAVKAIGKYQSGIVLGFSSHPQSLGSIIAVQTEDGIETLNECWLQPFVGLKFAKNGTQLTDSTIDDFTGGE